MKEKFNIDVYSLTEHYHEEPEIILTKNRNEFADYLTNLAKELGINNEVKLECVYCGKYFDISGFWYDGFDGVVEMFSIKEYEDLQKLFKKCYTCSRKLSSASFVLDYGGIAYEVTITCKHDKTFVTNNECEKGEYYSFRKIETVNNIIKSIREKNNLNFKEILYIDGLNEYCKDRTKVTNDVNSFTELCSDVLKKQNDICFTIVFLDMNDVPKFYNVYMKKGD